jgi:hypothetical protein
MVLLVALHSVSLTSEGPEVQAASGVGEGGELMTRLTKVDECVAVVWFPG